MRRTLPLLFALALSAACPTPAPAQTPASAGTIPAGMLKASRPVHARLLLKDDANTLLECMLLAAGATSFAYADMDNPAQIAGTMKFSEIARSDFEIKLDEGAALRAEREKKFSEAYKELSAGITPTLLFLPMPENNAVDRATRLAVVMMKLAARAARAAKTPEDKAKAVSMYERAYKIWDNISKADWAPDARALARVKQCQCLLRMGKPQEAADRLAEIEEPIENEEAYGHYWLTQGTLAVRQKNLTYALECAVKSVAFADKDVETFPAALLLSAQCYAALGEPYRARDIYFEMASLFPGTEEADEALRRLRAVLDSGKTKEKEDFLIENVFFAVNEDINELSEELLARREKEKEK